MPGRFDMDNKIIIVLLLTFIINIIGTLAYGKRVAGITTGKIAICFSIFNILALVSRTASSLQGPFLSKKIETSIALGSNNGLVGIFRYILLVSTIGCIFCVIIMPTFQRLFYKAVSTYMF